MLYLQNPNLYCHSFIKYTDPDADPDANPDADNRGTQRRERY